MQIIRLETPRPYGYAWAQPDLWGNWRVEYSDGQVSVKMRWTEAFSYSNIFKSKAILLDLGKINLRFPLAPKKN